ncbi:hypothetical protein JB92DRAFT_2902405 [Gautieria morchelliformis]|nr:hypothetical protein JB92DRAFT_2902405 [Gautieria morchelliformis]
MPRRPSLALVQPVTTATTSARRRHHVSDPPLSPHVTFSLDNQPHLSSCSLIATSSSYSNSLPTDSSASHNDSLPCSPSSSLTIMPLPPHSPSPYTHPIALPSLESLDLAGDADSFADKPIPASPNSKRHFRVPMPKLGFGRRHSIDFKTARPTDVAAPTIPAGDSTADPQSNGSHDDVWHGTRAFAVKRSSTIATAASPHLADKTSPTLPPSKSRRKFSLFSLSPPSHPSRPSSRDDTTPPVPVLPAPPNLKGVAATLLPNAVAGPSRPRDLSPTVPHVDLEDTTPFEQRQTLPARPARTDPYKTYGVPVPGSDQARAFLRAEKEWIRAEKERKDRDRALEGIVEVSRPRGQGGVKGPERQTSRKGKDTAPTHVLVPSDNSQSQNKKPVTEDNNLVEFDVLPVAKSALPQEQNPARPTSKGRRSWGFSCRPPEAAGENRSEKKERDKGRQAKAKSKSKDPRLTKSKTRPKSGDGSKRPFGFRSMDPPNSKDRGYVSDTGVPSFTYKLMA